MIEVEICRRNTGENAKRNVEKENCKKNLD